MHQDVEVSINFPMKFKSSSVLVKPFPTSSLNVLQCSAKINTHKMKASYELTYSYLSYHTVRIMGI